jgi:hypothetical protein
MRAYQDDESQQHDHEEDDTDEEEEDDEDHPQVGIQNIAPGSNDDEDE